LPEEKEKKKRKEAREQDLLKVSIKMQEKTFSLKKSHTAIPFVI